MVIYIKIIFLVVLYWKWGDKILLTGSLKITGTETYKLHLTHMKLMDFFYSQILKEGGMACYAGEQMGGVPSILYQGLG